MPGVLLVGPHAPAPEVLTLATRLDVQSPGIAVVLMADPSPEMWQAAMRAGIRDLLAPGIDVAEIHAAVERAGQAAASRRRVLRPAAETDRYTGQVITIPLAEGRGRQDHRVGQPGPRPDRTRAAVDRAGRPRRPVR